MSHRQAVPLIELRHSTPSQIEAIRELEQLFCLDKPTLLNVIESFQRELVAGLADDRSSDLNMIPTYVTGELFFFFFISMSFIIVIRLSYWLRKRHIFST